MLDYRSGTLKCLILSCYVEPMDTKIIRQIYRLTESVFYDLMPLSGREGNIINIKTIELHWTKDEGSRNVFLKGLAKVPRME